ncbi:hypothetical protein [Ruminococcus sp.]|uniref:hypothetical protein n=1 Tax=Ruminococcus sp. TaxID=41978 RepID=UPI0025F59585|nr:hypothetical protein [Ruminococcus sp.]MBQ8967718.1 hypothetical protein [Ruminococcus sp.]
MKNNISFYERGGEQAEKFREIDKFLGLSAHANKQNAKKTRVTGWTVGLLGAAAAAGLGVLLGRPVFYIGAAVFLVIGFYFGYFKFRKPYTPLLRTEKIIETDGIDRVYEDLMHCERIDRSEVYIGEYYLFRQNNFMVRMSDVRKCYVSNIESGDDVEYYCMVDVSDEVGAETLELRKLSAIKVQRQKQFEQINKPIESAKIRLS